MALITKRVTLMLTLSQVTPGLLWLTLEWLSMSLVSQKTCETERIWGGVGGCVLKQFSGILFLHLE